jgi:ferredoxin
MQAITPISMLSDSQLSALKWTIKKPHVNSTCIGCSACTAISGEVFQFDDDGLSCVIPLSSYDNHDVDDSIAACPVNAISWQMADAEGNYLNWVIEHVDV